MSAKEGFNLPFVSGFCCYKTPCTPCNDFLISSLPFSSSPSSSLAPSSLRNARRGSLNPWPRRGRGSALFSCRMPPALGATAFPSAVATQLTLMMLNLQTPKGFPFPKTLWQGILHHTASPEEMCAHPRQCPGSQPTLAHPFTSNLNIIKRGLEFCLQWLSGVWSCFECRLSFFLFFFLLQIAKRKV